MNPLEITLIIIGIIIIIISCLLVDKSSKTPSQITGQTYSIETIFSEDDRKKLTDKITDSFTELSEETIIRTDDALSKLSNEKIIAVSEFSDQILEKINRNHEEVVFLYNMLNDKEKELKETVKEIDSSKKKVQDIMEAKAKVEKTQAVKTVNNQMTQKPVSQTKPDKPIITMKNQMDSTQEVSQLDSENSNYNSKILELYSQGKSIMEISKLLSLGQGEVKLVIDLYKGKK